MIIFSHSEKRICFDMFEEESTEASFYSLFMLTMRLLQIHQLFIHSHFALFVNILAYWFLVALFILLTFHNNFMALIYIAHFSELSPFLAPNISTLHRSLTQCSINIWFSSCFLFRKILFLTKTLSDETQERLWPLICTTYAAWFPPNIDINRFGLF